MLLWFIGYSFHEHFYAHRKGNRNSSHAEAAINDFGSDGSFLIWRNMGRYLRKDFWIKAGVGTGLLWGTGLWLIMQIIFLPFLGWGFFGAAVTPAIAVATFILHQGAQTNFILLDQESVGCKKA